VTLPPDDKLLAWDPRDDEAWRARCAADIAAAEAFQTDELRVVTAQVVERATRLGAVAVALTGSTARRRRTAISDLDYHIVGRRPPADNLPGDVDLYAGDRERLLGKVLGGDDFVQWTLRCGCVLVDSGVLQEAAQLVLDQAIWPDGASKIARLPQLCGLAETLIGMEDRDAAQDQVRAALTSGARGLLLLCRVFPLSRSELPEQLREAGWEELAADLEATIYAKPELADLSSSLRTLKRAAHGTHAVTV